MVNKCAVAGCYYSNGKKRKRDVDYLVYVVMMKLINKQCAGYFISKKLMKYLSQKCFKFVNRN